MKIEEEEEEKWKIWNINDSKANENEMKINEMK